VTYVDADEENPVSRAFSFLYRDGDFFVARKWKWAIESCMSHAS